MERVGTGRTPNEIGRLAGRAVDPDELLDGEDPETLQTHDAQHWVRVYEELLSFKTALFRRAERMADDVSDSARIEIARSDLPIMDAQTKKLERRLAFWRGRLDELRREGSRNDGN
jgi:hypothetical protein